MRPSRPHPDCSSSSPGGTASLNSWPPSATATTPPSPPAPTTPTRATCCDPRSARAVSTTGTLTCTSGRPSTPTASRPTDAAGHGAASTARRPSSSSEPAAWSPPCTASTARSPPSTSSSAGPPRSPTISPGSPPPAPRPWPLTPRHRTAAPPSSPPPMSCTWCSSPAVLPPLGFVSQDPSPSAVRCVGPSLRVRPFQVTDIARLCAKRSAPITCRSRYRSARASSAAAATCRECRS
jgi:hypothetical protein